MSNAQYLHGHAPVVVAAHARRTAGEAAAFVLPLLSPGMTVLDLGCGPGTITVGLAEAIAPGQLVALDRAPDVLPVAAKNLEPAPNVSLLAGDVHALPFPDGSFDAVYAHQVLQHVSDPVGAMRSLRHKLRPGGILAVRDADYGTMTHAPHEPMLDRWLEVYHSVAYALGAEPQGGRHLLRWSLEAGFVDQRVSTSTWTYADAAGRQEWGEMWAQRAIHSSFADKALEFGFATSAELDAIAEAWRRWSQNPAGYFSFIHTEIVAFAP